jgi:hypothetical protein
MERIGTPGAGAWLETVAGVSALAQHRVRTAFRRTRWRTASERGWVAGIAPQLAAATEPATRAEPAAGAPSGDWFTEAVTLTDTAVVVAVVRCRTNGCRRVVKMPCTAEGAQSLQRQAAVLTALHTDPRLAGWLDVVPRHRTHGEIAGRRYWVEDAVPGNPVSDAALWIPGNGGVFAAGVELIHHLHSRTGDERTIKATDVDAWVNRPLSLLDTFYAARSRPDASTAALRRLGAKLSEELAGQRMRTSWIHGDFWPGNMLISGSALTGVVDWDQAEPRQLPLQDLLHLSLFAVRLRVGCELGDVVVRCLDNGLANVTGVSVRELDGWLGGLSHTSAVLLFWLRHISLYIALGGHGDNRNWVIRNVHSVLARC